MDRTRADESEPRDGATGPAIRVDSPQERRMNRWMLMIVLGAAACGNTEKSAGDDTGGASDDNDPDDVYVGSSSPTAYSAFGSSETFTCDSVADTCE